MDVERDYRLPFKGLQEGHYRYQFELPGLFFEQHASSELRSGELQAFVELTKRSNFLEMSFHIEGYVEVVCDRCLEYYRQDIETESKLFVKFGDKMHEESDELLVLPHTESEIDLSQYLYEFVLLGIPAKKVHPEKDGISGCDPEMLRLLNEHTKEKENDPRWDKLKDLNIKKK